MNESALSIVPLLILFILVFVGILKSTVIVQEFERGVIIRLGKCIDVAGPGLRFIVPFIDILKKVNLNEKLPGWQGLGEGELRDKVKDLVLLGKV